MGVLACDRNGCSHIMCRRLIVNDRFYICDECWTELLEHKATWEPPMSVRGVEAAIENFMGTVPGTYLTVANNCDIDEVFNRLTGNADN